jgi:leucyl aminopeptidase
MSTSRPSIRLRSTRPAGVDVVAVPVATGPAAVAGGPSVDLPALRARGFTGKVGETAQLDGVIAVGVGDAERVTPGVIRTASAAAVKAAGTRSSLANLLVSAAGRGRPAAVQAAAEGSALGGYRFTRYKRDNGDAAGLSSITVVARGADDLAAAVERGLAVADGVTLARDLVNTPSGDLTPVGLADAAADVAARTGLAIEVIDEERAAELGLGGITGVGRGSENPPRMIVLSYEPPGARRSLAWVGKGITFDSGGLSLKTGEGMMTMKMDMAGAAAVLGAMSCLAVTKPDVTVRAYLCAAENMPSGRAIRPGDVLTIRNGTTVEVLNTDAEGRLVLADGLSYAAEAKPDGIVDLATLTGAARAALGARIAALMGNDDAFIGQVQAAAEEAGEKVWPLPLPDEYRKMIDSSVADLKNVSGSGTPGALTAGLFLQEFVDGRPWAHLDIAGPAWTDDDADPLGGRGGTGYGVRTLLALADAFAAAASPAPRRRR